MIQRLSIDEALDLFTKSPLEELQDRAHRARLEKNPGNLVSFVLDSNPNYTNVCNADCTFCAFYRKKNHKEAYTLSLAEVCNHLQFAKDAGLTTVLLQGGLNDELPLSYYTELIAEAIKRFPEVHPHFFTAPELINVARVEGISIRKVLQALYAAGQRTIPGGGAEILSERVRKQVSPKKMGPHKWAEFHRTAHEEGFRTTATMMYGHVEDPIDIMIHLQQLRDIQDATGGFTAFIPWSYKRTNTALRRKVESWVGPEAYYRILAISRLFLDNFQHVQASWYSEGKEVGKQALWYGADDFGGIILEENVHKATGFIHKIHAGEMVDLIREAGFTPARRKTPLYDLVEIYSASQEVQVPELQKERAAEKDSFIPILN